MAEDRGEGFFGRWSRLKQARRVGDDVRDLPDSEAPTPESPDPATKAAEPPAEAGVGEGDEALDLPPIESLDRDSDFTVFLKEGVPEEIRRQALRKLWLTDPVLANLDGLVEYGEDFNEPWRTTTVVKTLYRVGQGMPGALEDLEEIAEDVAGEPGIGEPDAERSDAARPEEPPASRPADESAGSGEADDAVAEARPSEPAPDQSAGPVPSKPSSDA